MFSRELSIQEKDTYNIIVSHPLQSWEWGAFREKTGVEVNRFGTFSNNALREGFQVFFHSIPKTPFTIGYIPRGALITKEMLAELERIGDYHNCIFVKLEPNVSINDPMLLKIPGAETFSAKRFALQHPKLKVSKKPLFTPFTFQIDLTKPEEALLSQMNQKTRYNIRLAQKKGVTIQEDNSEKAFEIYLKLTMETTKRQKFFAHNETYHRTMWQILKPSGIAHLLTATYNQKIITTWILLLFNNTLYYPYGASSNNHREVMASNLMMWEAIKWGKAQGAALFDLWGALGPNPNPKDNWYGFHRFKAGYGGKLVEFIGSYDYVLKPALYPIYNVAEKMRWFYLQGTTLLWSVPKLW